MTNGNEWLALTDRRQPGELLPHHRSLLATGDIDLTFPTVVGRNYTFEFTSTSRPTWTPIGGPLPGIGSPITHPIGPVTGYPQLFVRIRVGP